MVKIVEFKVPKKHAYYRKIELLGATDLFKKIDFLIIGAGIVGYSTALHLRKKYPNSKIVIVERGFLPSGASSKNAGFACFGSATEIYDDLLQMSNSDVWQTVERRWKGLQYLRSLIGDQELELYTLGSWDLITEKQRELFNATRDRIEEFNRAVKEITGEGNVYSVDDHVGEKFGFQNIETSFYNRLEGQINTGKMNAAFYKQVIAQDIQVLFGIEAKQIHETGKNALVETNIGDLSASNVSICTNGFAARFIHEESISPARAQVLITEPIDKLKLKGTFHYDRGYYYFRNIDDRILFGGGRNLDFSGETTTELTTTERIQKELERILREAILPDQPFNIEHRWAGIMGVGTTKKPIVKQVSEHCYCGVRLGGMGVAIGTLVGKEISDLINH